MRIAFVTCHFPPDSIGGGQVQSLRLCEALSRDHQVTVFVRDYRGDRCREEMRGNLRLSRRRVVRLPIVRSLVDLVKLLGLIRNGRGNSDLFMSFHAQLAALAVVTGSVLFHTPSAVSPRGAEDYDGRTWYRRVFQRFLYRHATLILVQTSSLREGFLLSMRQHYGARFSDAIAPKIIILPNVIDRRPQWQDRAAAAGSPRVLAFVGRLVEYKGLETALKAMEQLKAGFLLQVVGDGPMRETYENRAKGLPVRFLGALPIDAVDAILESTSVVVIPSDTEHLPNAALEALAQGVPVVASSVGALPEIIEPGVNGALVPPRDPDALADAVRNIVDEADGYRRYSYEAWKSVARFGSETVVPEFVTIVEQRLHMHATTS